MYNLKILALGPGQIGKSTFLFRLLGLMKGNIDTAATDSLPPCSTGQADLREVCIKFASMTGAITPNKQWDSCCLESQVEALIRLSVEQVQNEVEEVSSSSRVTSSKKGSRSASENLSQTNRDVSSGVMETANKDKLNSQDNLSSSENASSAQYTSANSKASIGATTNLEPSFGCFSKPPINNPLVAEAYETYEKFRKKLQIFSEGY